MSLLLSLVLSCSLFKITAQADNTEDLLNVFGLTLGDTTKSEIEQEIDAIVNEIENNELLKGDVKKYNDALSVFLEDREKQINDTQEKILKLNSYNETVVNKIESGILTLSINELSELDGTYKRNKKSINDLFDSLDYFVTEYSYKDFNDNSSNLNDKLKSAYQVYADSLDTFDLGDVKDIKFPIVSGRNVWSPYGYRINPKDTSEIRFHSGVDYFAKDGVEVQALFNGEVIDVGYSKVIGNFVVVQCGENIKYIICHCSDVLVAKGNKVKQYDAIATAGSTGSQSDKSGVHIALYINGSSYNVDTLFTTSERQ